MVSEPETRVREGAYGYDVGQVPPQPVLITNADKGPVKSHKASLRELILDSPGNQAHRVDMETPTVGIQYIELDGSGGKEYTMPVTRIATPPVEIDMGDGSSLPPDQYTMHLALRSLFAEVVREDDAVQDAVVDAAERSTLPDAVVDRLVEDDGS